MHTLHAHRLLYLFAFLALLASCEQLSMPKPQTIEQSILYVHGGITASYETIGDLVIAGQISTNQRDETVAQLDKGTALLKTARRALKAGDSAAAQTDLERAKSLLSMVESTLKSLDKGAK